MIKLAKTIRFGGSVVGIHGTGSQSINLLEFLFGEVFSPFCENYQTQLFLEYREKSGSYHCFHEENPLYVGESEGNVARRLMDSTIYHVADTSVGGLMLHAAALEYDNKIILIPGKSGAGKSTLTSWLTCNGFRYLTDELVFIPTDTTRLEAFTRPINIKTRGLPVIQSFLDPDKHEKKIVRGGFATLIPHSLLNPEPANRNARLAAILFPRYEADYGFELAPMSQADGGMRLMEMLINARNLDGHGFNQTTRLAKSVPAYSLRYSGFEDVAEQLTTMFEQIIA
ncbi:MAG: hypothetical protein DHS20C01_12360 [marine bacterium B5-7]|nr:MAG: hypothetical protein DHS20C01_12360 [marine bacterium B5-7]